LTSVTTWLWPDRWLKQGKEVDNPPRDSYFLDRTHRHTLPFASKFLQSTSFQRPSVHTKKGLSLSMLWRFDPKAIEDWQDYNARKFLAAAGKRERRRLCISLTS
jgi:hypothetical protein